MSAKLIVIGGGAAGFFGAIAAAAANPHLEVTILEKTAQLLHKVRISGGGRCNVTHACFDPSLLVQNYPRGGQALRGAFTRFQPKDTMAWFEERGVQLKIEEDGRIFPITNSSETIIHCLLEEAKKLGVNIRLGLSVDDVERTDHGYLLTLANHPPLECEALLVTTGSHPKAYNWLKKLGHTIVPPVPSLFTFNLPTSPLLDLAGITVDNVCLKLAGGEIEQRGPLLLTHWGFSGPAALKLSAWEARVLHDAAYKATLLVNWVPHVSRGQIHHSLLGRKKEAAAKIAGVDPLFALPKNLWKRLLSLLSLDQKRWSEVSHKEMLLLADLLHSQAYQVDGKSIYKQEFVTCGGVNLSEVNFKTLESKCSPQLFFAGEVLDIDGVTGGFNFQNAWTTAWLAGNAIASRFYTNPPPFT